MKNSLFNPENWLWQPFGKVADFLFLSALWILTSLPLFTIGASLTALYDCSAHCVKNGDGGMLSRYFRTFKRELLTGGLSFLLWAVIIGGIILLINRFTSTAAPTTLNLVLAYASFFLLVLVVGIAAWVFPLLSRFTFGIADLNLTAFRLAITQLPRTIVLGVCTSLIVWICLRFWIPLFVAPGIYGLLVAYILEPVFREYDGSKELEEEMENETVS